MLRAISETAVAMSVASVRENPSFVASERVSARARTRSSSRAIAIRSSSSIATAHVRRSEECDRLIQVERGLKRCQIQAEVDDCDGDLRLYSGDDRPRAAQADRQ